MCDVADIVLARQINRKCYENKIVKIMTHCTPLNWNQNI